MYPRLEDHFEQDCTCLSQFFRHSVFRQAPRRIAQELGFSQKKSPPPPKPPPPARTAQPSDGALQTWGILQRDARLVDFLMEDISAYSDDQVGAADGICTNRAEIR